MQRHEDDTRDNHEEGNKEIYVSIFDDIHDDVLGA
jgi:hypothetical protein